MNRLLIKSNRFPNCLPAEEYDCVYLTYPGDRHTSVQKRIAGTITTREGELGVVVRVFL